MATNFTVIFGVRQHFGDDEDYLKDVEPGLPFVGPTKDFSFDCPNVVRGASAMLMFQTRDVDHNKNIIQINPPPHPAAAEQPTVFGGIPVSPNKDTWNGNTMLIRSGVLIETGNELHIQSRNSSGGGGGELDDFIIDNCVVLYKTRESVRQIQAAAALQPLSSGTGLRLFPPHFKTPVEVCGPCVNGEQVCLTTRFTWKCEVIVEGHEGPLGIPVPPITVCGWEMEIVNVRTKKCFDRDKATQVFLPALG